MDKAIKNAFLSIPCHWDTTVIEAILALESQNSMVVSEVYGALANGGPVGHGRASGSVANLAREDALRFRLFLKQNGLKLTYLLNAPFGFDGSDKQRGELDEYLRWILDVLRPDSLTISSLDLMRYVRTIDKEVPINISTIASVRNVADLKKFMEVNPRRVIPQHDVGKEHKPLLDLIQFCHKEGVELELMATESCLFRCPDMKSHYKSLAKGRSDRRFHLTCNSRKLSHPQEFLIAGGLIRPEDVVIYEEMGLSYFKITGRSKPAAWLPEVVSAYLSRAYGGNLIRLLGIDPLLRAEEWVYIENTALEGLLPELLDCNKYADKLACAERWIVRLGETGKFRLLDGSLYELKGNLLELSVVGEKAKVLF